MPVAEVLLSGFISLLFVRLASGEFLNFLRQEGIDTELKKWKSTLQKIKAVLADAEDKRTTDRAVKLWLDDLQDLAYDLDDVLDELATELSRRKLMDEPHASTSKVQKLIPSCCTSFSTSPATVVFHNKMRSKIKEIGSRLQEIAQQKNDLGLTEIGEGRRNPTTNRLPATSLVDESRVYGREEDKQAVIKLLLSDHEGQDGEVCVIPIVGMGGLGKTTLAQLVYNDDRVRGCFDLMAWACVSDEFDVLGVTKTILGTVTPQSCDTNDLNMLQVRLKESLSRKKFLVVLDDVWNENYGKWDVLRGPFLAGLPGSKIIVTTRLQSVASIMSYVPAYHLNVLADDDCLSLLAQHAIGRRNFAEHPNQKGIGEQIVKKCQGLPLAAKTLGGLLRTKHAHNEWMDILHSQIWDLSEQMSDILPALRLSYHHLPPHLKPCFAYCSIFPKAYEFDENELVLLWMAEGFLWQQEGRKQMEDFGHECFDELLSRSFFQQSRSHESRFVMHDLINDLAQHMAGETCFRLEINEYYKISKRARHSSYMREKYECFQKFKSLDKAQHLRTFLPLPFCKLYNHESFYLTNMVLVDLLPNLPYLRVLFLCEYSISELPESISDLKHLRYLNLSGTLIKQLPESVSTLFNLQILSLRNCSKLRQLPTSIGSLVHLRHLDNSGTNQLVEMPLGIGKMKSLQSLSKIVVSKISGFKLRELGDLKLLRGRLSIEELQNVMDIQDVMEADLKQKQGIDELRLKWSSDFDKSRNENFEMNVLELLQPCMTLKKLEILFYGGVKFPRWVGDPSFSKIVKISLIGCAKCTCLPPLGQLSTLKDLCFKRMPQVRSVGAEFYGENFHLQFPFQSLESLSFEDMPEWEEWSSFDGCDSQFPKLRELSVCWCPKLTRILILRLPSLVKLELKECKGIVLKSLTELTSLETLIMKGVMELTQLEENLLRWFSVAPQNLGTHLSLGLGLGEEGELGLHCNLQVLELERTENVEKLPNWLFTSLRELSIVDCPKFESLPNGICSSSALEKLRIDGCSSLRSIGQTIFATLKSLMIENCLHLEATILQDNSMSLESLGMVNWQNFRRSSLECIQSFASLVQLWITGCDGVESFPDRGLPAPNLRSLFIDNCRNLRSLPCQIQSLTSLRNLGIYECKSLECFPNDDLHFPPNLTHLYIEDCEKLKPLSKWQMHRLTSVQSLGIKGGNPELVSFSDDECPFPPSLTYLRLGTLLKLESLSRGFQNLTALKELTILDCPKLRSLPKEEALLGMLSSLHIYDCPLLKQRCLKDKGDYWPKISHIPRLELEELT